MNFLKLFGISLLDRELAPTAFKVSLVVGSILFTINHGSAFIKGQMNAERWLSGCFTYLVPYCVNIHGQSISRKRNTQQ